MQHHVCGLNGNVNKIQLFLPPVDKDVLLRPR